MSAAIVGSINHVAIAMPNIEAARETYNQLGLPIGQQNPFPKQTVDAAFIELSNAKLEPLQPHENSLISNFVAANPQGGLHHICFNVDDIDKAIDQCRQAGLQFTTETHSLGAHNEPVIFLHPKGTGGVLIELEQRAKREITKSPKGFARDLRELHIVSNTIAPLVETLSKLGLKAVGSVDAEHATFDTHDVTIRIFSPAAYTKTLYTTPTKTPVASPLAAGPKGSLIAGIVVGTKPAEVSRLANEAGSEIVNLPAPHSTFCMRPAGIRNQVGYDVLYAS